MTATGFALAAVVAFWLAVFGVASIAGAATTTIGLALAATAYLLSRIPQVP